MAVAQVIRGRFMTGFTDSVGMFDNLILQQNITEVR